MFVFKIRNTFTTFIFICHLASILMVFVGSMKSWSFHIYGLSIIMTITYLVFERKNTWYNYLFISPLLINYFFQLFHLPLIPVVKLTLLVL